MTEQTRPDPAALDAARVQLLAALDTGARLMSQRGPLGQPADFRFTLLADDLDETGQPVQNALVGGMFRDGLLTLGRRTTADVFAPRPIVPTEAAQAWVAAHRA